MIQFVYKLEYNSTIVKRCLIRNFSSIHLEIQKLVNTASKNGISNANSIPDPFLQISPNGSGNPDLPENRIENKQSGRTMTEPAGKLV